MTDQKSLNPKRIVRNVNLLFIARSASIITILLLLLIFFTTNIQWILNFQGYQDFGSFFDSSLAFINGGNPYADHYENVFSPIINEQSFPSPNLNPPFFLFFSRLFIMFNLQTSYPLWQAVSFFLFGLSIFILLKGKILSWSYSLLMILIVINFAGIWHTIKLGQIYFPLLLLTIISYYFIDKNRFFLAGIPIGLICAIKPNFAIIIICFFLIKNHRLFLSSLITAIICYLVPLIILGITPYIQWINAMANYKGYIIPGNSSIVGLFARYGLTTTGYIITIILLLVSLILILFRQLSNKNLLTLGILLSLVCSPITWSGYTILLIPYFLSKTWQIFDLIAALLLTLPITVMYSVASLSDFSMLTFGWIYGYALIILLFGHLVSLWRNNPNYISL